MGVLRACLVRFAEVQGVDRAMALGAQAFSALLPLLIVYGAVVPQRDGRDFADRIIDRFDLHGTAARSLRQAIAPQGEVTQSISVIGVLLLVVAALAFTRALQRLYEGAFGLPALGMRGTKYGLQWLLALIVLLTVRPFVSGSVVVALALGAGFWLLTPLLLLGRRVAWRRLVPSAVFTTLLMSALGVVSAIWVPRSVASSADDFGAIGVAFAILGWLVAAGFVLVASATIGAVVQEYAERRELRTRSAPPAGRAAGHGR
jgi:membrane protein